MKKLSKIFLYNLSLYKNYLDPQERQEGYPLSIVDLSSERGADSLDL